MSEQQRGSFGKKVWIGGSIAVAAAAFAVFSGVIDYPPTGKDVSGTIAPATRYRADQPQAGDIKLGVQAGGQSGAVAPGGQAGLAAQDGLSGKDGLAGKDGVSAQH